MRVAWMDDVDLKTLGFPAFQDALAAGIASHHAGMLPVFKEAVEELFEAGLVKVVFATETLSLGINMPARSVVIEDLWKFQGERHELLTPGEYTQLTGRAGRQGDRRARPRGRRVPAPGPLRARGLARLDAHVRAHVVVPTLLQHGREPRAELLARGGPPPAELVVRAVPRRPRGGRARTSARAGQGGPRRLPRADALSPRRLHRVLGAPPAGRADPRPGSRRARTRARRRRPASARVAAAGRRRSSCRVPSAAAWPWCFRAARAGRPSWRRIGSSSGSPPGTSWNLPSS